MPGRSMSRSGRLLNQEPNRFNDRGENMVHTLLRRLTIVQNSHHPLWRWPKTISGSRDSGKVVSPFIPCPWAEGIWRGISFPVLQMSKESSLGSIAPPGGADGGNLIHPVSGNIREWATFPHFSSPRFSHSGHSSGKKRIFSVPTQVWSFGS